MNDAVSAVSMAKEPLLQRGLARAREIWGGRFYITFVALILIYGLLVTATANYFSSGVTATSNLYSNLLHYSIAIFLVLYILYRPIHIMVFVRPEKLTRAILKDFGDGLFNARRLLSALPILLFMPFFFSMFTSAKNLIPVVNPFFFDPKLAEIESWMHFGKTPWEWLQPVLGVALVTSIISAIYKTWFFSKFVVCLWQAFERRRPRLREQYFLTFVLSWIVNGTILALLMSSAGPCFYGEVYPGAPNPYAGLMPYLRQANETHIVHDLLAMDFLMFFYTLRETEIFSGISAMPSMHVSVAFLFVLLARRVNPVAYVSFSIYFVLILIGSIHLGWHYALDGYVAVVVTWLLWRLSGWWLGVDPDAEERLYQKQRQPAPS